MLWLITENGEITTRWHRSRVWKCAWHTNTEKMQELPMDLTTTLACFCARTPIKGNNKTFPCQSLYIYLAETSNRCYTIKYLEVSGEDIHFVGTYALALFPLKPKFITFASALTLPSLSAIRNHQHCTRHSRCSHWVFVTTHCTVNCRIYMELGRPSWTSSSHSSPLLFILFTSKLCALTSTKNGETIKLAWERTAWVTAPTSMPHKMNSFSITDIKLTWVLQHL